MILVDVNVLVYAHRTDTDRHAAYRDWLTALVNGDEPFGMASEVLSGFLRVVTHARVFDPPTPVEEALRFAEAILRSDRCVRVRPGPRHWEIFAELVRSVNAKGNLVPDAFVAALALESGSEWVTTDRDFRRFPGLRVRHPLD